MIEIKGERLEEYHLNQIRKEEEIKEDSGSMEEEEEELENEGGQREKLKMKIAYNDKRLSILKKRR